MAFTRKKKIASSALLVLTLLAGYGVYQTVFAVQQGRGTLAQAPMNISSSATPAFIMTVDDSGSMTFQTQFPGQDGEGCWNTSQRSFFDASGNLNTTGNCDYFYVLPGARISGSYYGIPPLDTLGFARSSQYNPTYYDPTVKYEPWGNAPGGTVYPAASTSATLIDPRNATTVALAAWRQETTESFRIQNGMFLPSTTQYSTGGNWKTVGNNGLIWNSGAQDIYIRYWPATFFMRWVSDSDSYPALAGDAAAYSGVQRDKISNACGSGCTMWKYTIQPGNTTALQNFANWFSYYGNRNRAMIAGMTRSLQDENRMRIGYFTINNYTKWDRPATASERLTMYDMSNSNDKLSLFSSLVALPASGGTPNRYAVNAANAQFTRTDSGAPVLLQCQKNAVMLFTDGYSNGGQPTVGNIDGGMGAPFSDSNSNTLADIATKYYLDDSSGGSPLRTDLAAGRVPVPDECKGTPDPSVDCQTNLHINFYGVTLGAKGNLYNPDVSQNPYTSPAIYNNWPAAQDNQPSTVDDIWHAAVNTRGEYINARTPVDITDAMRRILTSVAQGASPSGSISASGARVGPDSFSISPFYEATNNSTDWYGKLTAQTVASNSITGVVSYAQLWEASAMLPAPAARNVWFGRYAGASAQTLRFSSSNVALADLCTEPTPSLSVCSAALIGQRLRVGGGTGTSITAGQAVSYLLGDQSLESSTLRKRTTRLGDIVNSSPVVAAPTDDYGYRSMAGATAGSYDPYNYAAYLTTKQSRPRVVFAGANDGMLHAFDGATGTERFGYIPTTALGHMGNLLFPYNAADKNNQVFQHRYFVDGQMTVSDVYAGGAWKTVLVGAAGAGGRGVFGLDVSSPATFTGANVLWEVNDRSSNATIADNIGYVLGKPVIVPVKTTDGTVAWKAIFGNGYNSNGGKAVLFVVDVGTGAVQAIQANESGAPAGSNGLGSIVVVDSWSGTGLTSSGRDGYADTVYAADQKGAIWKFDLRAATPANQTVPVFVTNTDSSGLRQPILGGLAAAAAPSGGVMVFFGTGSFSFEGDATDTTVQSLYGVQDRPGRTATLTRANLTAQTIGTTSADTRATSMNPLASGKLGWYMDLPAGERVVGNPRIESGILFIPTYLPDVSGTTGCASNGSNWLYGLDALSGAAGLMGVRVGSPTGDSKPSGSGAIKLETGGSAPVTDTAAFVSPRIKPLSATATATEVNNAIAAQCSMVVQAPGAQPLYVPRACGRQSWRQIK